jgi:hypothetical protein
LFFVKETCGPTGSLESANRGWRERAFMGKAIGDSAPGGNSWAVDIQEHTSS